MKSRLKLLAVFLMLPVLLGAEPHTFTDRDGNKLEAHLSGAADGMVVLRPTAKRLLIPLAAFTLKDRDYIVRTLAERGKEELIAQLMEFGEAHGVRVTPPKRLTGINGPDDALPNSLYDVPIPHGKLLEDPPAREWIDILGKARMASFDSITETGHVRLTTPEQETDQIALVNLSREDLEYVANTIEADAARPIFPKQKSRRLTSQERMNGYQNWTDRNGNELKAKFLQLMRNGTFVLFEVDGEQQEFPLRGLCEDDCERINQTEGEVQGPGENLEVRNKEVRQEAGRIELSMLGNRKLPDGVETFLPIYEKKCRNCGELWITNSKLPYCEDCRKTHRYECENCGHRWTNSVWKLDDCPNCHEDLGSSQVAARSEEKSSDDAEIAEAKSLDEVDSSADAANIGETSEADAQESSFDNLAAQLTDPYLGFGACLIVFTACVLYRRRSCG